jgi:hypothetical protein
MERQRLLEQPRRAGLRAASVPCRVASRSADWRSRFTTFCTDLHGRRERGQALQSVQHVPHGLGPAFCERTQDRRIVVLLVQPSPRRCLTDVWRDHIEGLALLPGGNEDEEDDDDT